MISMTYDLDLPPLVTVVFCTLQYWMLTRNRRRSNKRSEKISKCLGNSSCDEETTTGCTKDITIVPSLSSDSDVSGTSPDLASCGNLSCIINRAVVECDNPVLCSLQCDECVTLVRTFSKLPAIKEYNDSAEQNANSMAHVPNYLKTEENREGLESTDIVLELERSSVLELDDSIVVSEGTECFASSQHDSESGEEDCMESLRPQEKVADNLQAKEITDDAINIVEEEEDLTVSPNMSYMEIKAQNDSQTDESYKTENNSNPDNDAVEAWVKSEGLMSMLNFPRELEPCTEKLEREIRLHREISVEVFKEDESVIILEDGRVIPDIEHEAEEKEEALIGDGEKQMKDDVEVESGSVHECFVEVEELEVLESESVFVGDSHAQEGCTKEKGVVKVKKEEEEEEENEQMGVFESNVKNGDLDENEDSKSQMSGTTNEASEDSGVDNVERSQRASSARSLESKSESEEEDCDSCLSSEDATLATKSENDTAELEDAHGVAEEARVEVAGSEDPVPDENGEDAGGVYEPPPPLQTESFFSFVFPRHFAGFLIGKEGSGVRSLHKETGAALVVREHALDNCVLVTISSLGPEGVMRGLVSLKRRFSSFSCVDFDAIVAESPDVREMRKALDPEQTRKYELTSVKFRFPSDVVGILIGRNGRAVNEVSEATGVEIHVEELDEKSQAVVIVGIPDNIEKARLMIKKRFPAEEFPSVNMDETLPQVPTRKVEINEFGFMAPIEGLETVKVTSILSTEHFFVQRTSLPMHRRLVSFSLNLNSTYRRGPRDPLPRPIRGNTLCVVELKGSFYRALTLECRKHESRVMFVDFGGEKVYKNNELYIIRQQFINYNFQAVECFLDGISPVEGDEYTKESLAYVHRELANKDFFMRPVRVDRSGRTLVELFEKGDPCKGLVNIAMRAAQDGVVRYYPSLH